MTVATTRKFTKGTVMSDWKSGLDRAVAAKAEHVKSEATREAQTTSRLQSYFENVVNPAIEEFTAEMEKRGRTVQKYLGREFSSLAVDHGGTREMEIEVRTRGNAPEIGQAHFDTRKHQKYGVVHFAAWKES